jgi:DNA gyrase subunit A
MEIAVRGQDLNLLVVSERGHGKRTPVEDYPVHGRGGQGVITFKTQATGDLITARMVDAEHELILISEGGIILRTQVAHISQQGRPTQGVKLMNVGDDDRVAAVAVIDMRKEYSSEPLPTGAEATNGADGAKKPKASANGNKPKASRDGSNGRGKKGK